MKGDFSRDTFDPRKHYTGVRLQQGRVQLDADFNEQADITQHLLRMQVKEMLGASGTSQTDGGFELRIADRLDSRPSPEESNVDDDETSDAQTEQRSVPDLKIGAGIYYVDGVLCWNEQEIQTAEHPHLLSRRNTIGNAQRVLAFLDVWQRHLTANEDPSIRDVALTGSDTSTRTKTVWQIGFLPLDDSSSAVESPVEPSDEQQEAAREAAAREAATREVAAAWRAWPQRQPDLAQLEATCDGLGMVYENHLYRIEIHDPQRPSFKWSRDNGSVAFRVAQEEHQPNQEEHQPNQAEHQAQQEAKGRPKIKVVQPGELQVGVEDLARRSGELKIRDLIELVDDEGIRTGQRRPLCQIELIDVAANQLTLLVMSSNDDPTLFEQESMDALENPVLIRWDHDWPEDRQHYDGAIAVEDDTFLPLERGIKVRFSKIDSLRAGDYWTIPARAQRQGIEWPHGESRPPEGIDHHYSPLAIITRRAGAWTVEHDVRPKFVRQVEIPGKLAELEKKLRDEHEKTTKRLDEKIDALAKALRLERFCSPHELMPGQIVARVAGTHDQVELVNPANARLVAGVVAVVVKLAESHYEVHLHSHGETDLCVVGPVQPGDLLVPSDCEGRACRAGLFIRPGTLIAKAVTSNETEDDTAEKTIKGIIVFG